MIEPHIHKEILRRLAAAEVEHKVKIIYACESGSRAWGFASPDSDYDVRFIYMHEEDWYLSFDVERRRDVIEYPIVDEIDCNGWDIRKALYLFTRTNGALLEWFVSPIKYIEIGNFANEMRKLAPKVFNDIALCYHYNRMASGNASKYLFKPQVRLKKYFYVLRPLFSINYIKKFHLPPPIEFDKLLSSVAPQNLIPHIDSLLKLKRETPEIGLGDSIPEIDEYIKTELDRYEFEYNEIDRPELLGGEETSARLNEIYRTAIRQ